MVADYHSWTDDELIEEADERTLSQGAVNFLNSIMEVAANRGLSTAQRYTLIKILQENDDS